MIQLVAEIHQANADASDIFDYIVEALEMITIRWINLMKYLCQT